MTDIPGEDTVVAHAQPIPEHVRASQAMYADGQVGPYDLTQLDPPRDVAVPEPWPDEVQP